MKTDKWEAYQSSTVGLFSCLTTSWKIAKIITKMVKADFFLLLEPNNNFWNNKFSVSGRTIKKKLLCGFPILKIVIIENFTNGR